MSGTDAGPGPLCGDSCPLIPTVSSAAGTCGHWQLYLSGKAASEVHGTRAGFVGLQPQHHRGGQLVMGSATTGLLLGDETGVRTLSKA